MIAAGVGQRGNGTALGRAVQLGHDQARQLHRLVERLHLREHVLAGVAVEHQQHLVRRIVHRLADHAADLLQLVHQVALRRQAAGRVHHHHVHLAGLAGLDRVEGHRRRVAALVGDHLHVVALAPAGQLLARGRAEGVTGGQQHRLLDLVQVASQLADRGGLAGAVHPGDHHHQRVGTVDVDRLLQRGQQLGQDVDQRCLERGSIIDPVTPGALAQLGQQPFGRAIAGVAGQQRILQILVECLVDLAAREDAADLRAGA